MASVFAFIALFRQTSEASTVFLNIRWCLLTLNRKHSLLFQINGYLIIIVYAVFRILTIVPNWVMFFAFVNTPDWYAIALVYKLICVISCVSLDIFNLYWFAKIIKIFIKQLNTSSSSSIKHETYNNNIIKNNISEPLMDNNNNTVKKIN